MNNSIFTQYGHDPILLFQNWYDEAERTEINDPETICLATADKDGRPSARMVLLKEISERGFKFHTNATSEKGQDILENPHVSFCLYWKSTRKQIRVTGTASLVSDAESDEYFKTRPRARAIGAWASLQSQTFDDEGTLDAAIAAIEQGFKDTDQIPRPPHWKGYLIKPDRIEFWIANKDRLHTRFIYTQNDKGNWNASWMHP